MCLVLKTKLISQTEELNETLTSDKTLDEPAKKVSSMRYIRDRKKEGTNEKCRLLFPIRANKMLGRPRLAGFFGFCYSFPLPGAISGFPNDLAVSLFR
jgi:hypothetical protein